MEKSGNCVKTGLKSGQEIIKMYGITFYFYQWPMSEKPEMYGQDDVLRNWNLSENKIWKTRKNSVTGDL